MAETQTQFLARYVESAAYHEAGHITAAAVQQMPLQERGVHVDSEGGGISYYWHREPGDRSNSAQDQLERERTVIAIYAGRVAQERFFPYCPEDAWSGDEVKCCALLEEMYPADLDAQGAARNTLLGKAAGLVAQHWSVIEGLARALLAKPYVAQPETEIQEGLVTCEKSGRKMPERL